MGRRTPEPGRCLPRLLQDLDLDARADRLSGGERRRVALAARSCGGSTTCCCSTSRPTTWTSRPSAGWPGTWSTLGKACVVVTHDRWFLDAVCDRTWELADGQVHAYEGGYSAYVLARAERARIADGQRAAAAEPAAQGAGLAAARAAGPDLQAEVPDRGGERADRRRAARRGMGLSCAAGRRPARQDRVRRRGRDRRGPATAAAAARTSPGSSARASGSAWSASTAAARPRCSQRAGRR